MNTASFQTALPRAGRLCREHACSTQVHYRREQRGNIQVKIVAAALAFRRQSHTVLLAGGAQVRCDGTTRKESAHGAEGTGGGECTEYGDL